mgnify:FL=1
MTTRNRGQRWSCKPTPCPPACICRHLPNDVGACRRAGFSPQRRARSPQWPPSSFTGHGRQACNGSSRNGRTSNRLAGPRRHRQAECGSCLGDGPCGFAKHLHPSTRPLSPCSRCSCNPGMSMFSMTRAESRAANCILSRFAGCGWIPARDPDWSVRDPGVIRRRISGAPRRNRRLVLSRNPQYRAGARVRSRSATCS